MAATADWQPQPEPLKQLAQYLNDSLSGRDPNVQRNAENMLKQAKSSPDIDNYLCFLLCSQQTPEAISLTQDGYHAARSAAGIMLKNDIKTHYASIAQPSRAYIKSTVLFGLQDPNAQIRNYAGNVVTELVRSAGLTQWPEALPQLVAMVENKNGSQESQEGAMGALFKVCEDNRNELMQMYDSARPLDVLIPKLLAFIGSQVPKVRSAAIGSASLFILEKAPPMMENLDFFLAQIFALANDSSDEVRKQICRAIIQIAEVAPSRIAPHMEGLVDYMITQQRNVDDPELALDAAEFWLSISEDKSLRSYLAPYLPKIVPTLLECMVYSEDDVITLESEAEDAEEEDREEDIKPQFATSKTARTGAATGAKGVASGANGASAEPDDDLSEGELEDYDEGDAFVDPEEQWNLRKCSAAALDTLSGVFPQAVFETTLPYLKDNLTHADWPNREAAVLAIGAIAEGCMEFVEPHLPDLIPFLVSLLSDTTPVVRQITCWSLGRYSAWASHLDPPGQEQFFLPMMDGILKRMLDNTKRVQEAAASAFANLEEKAGTQLANPKYCEVISRQFSECFAKYKDRNMFILYDCVETLAENVGPTLANPELVHYLMPAIMKRWEKVPDASREIFPLFECLSYVATALGNTFVPYAAQVFTRCIRIIYQNLQDSLTAANHLGALDPPDKDFLVTSLDLLSSVIQALGSDKATQLLNSPEASQQANMFDLLTFCLDDGNVDVRQSAYALLGDSAIFVFPLLAPYLERALAVLVSQLDLVDGAPDAEDGGHPVKNNACWSCGEIAMRASREILSPCVETLLQRLFAILAPNNATNHDDVPLSLQENAAVALGRLGWPGNGCAEQLAPHLVQFAPVYLTTIASIDWAEEKAQSLTGFTEMVLLNPRGLEQCLGEFVVEIARGSVENPAAVSAKGGPHAGFQKALTLYKNNIPNFDGFLQQLPPQSAQTLRQVYSL